MVNTTIIGLFGNCGETRMFKYITDTKEVDYTVTDVAEGTGVTRPTANKLVNRLFKEEVLIKTRSVGGTQLYKLNKDNKLAKLMMIINKLIMGYDNEQNKANNLEV